MARITSWWTVLVQRHPPWILALTALVTVLLAGGLGRLEFKSSEDTMIPSGSTVYTDNVRYQHQFGDRPDGDRVHGRPPAPARRRTTSRAPRAPAPARDWTVRTTRCSARSRRSASPPTSCRSRPKLALDALARDEAQATTPAARDELAAEFQPTHRRPTRRDSPTVGPHSLDNPAFVDFLVHDATGAVRPSLRGVFPDDVTR